MELDWLSPYYNDHASDTSAQDDTAAPSKPVKSKKKSSEGGYPAPRNLFEAGIWADMGFPKLD